MSDIEQIYPYKKKPLDPSLGYQYFFHFPCCDETMKATESGYVVCSACDQVFELDTTRECPEYKRDDRGV